MLKASRSLPLQFRFLNPHPHPYHILLRPHLFPLLDQDPIPPSCLRNQIYRHKHNMATPSLPKTMRAAVIYEAGGPDVLKLETRPVPTPNENEVLIQIKAFGL